MANNTTKLYVIDNYGRKVLYQDWEKIPMEQLEEFERCIHAERVRRAVSEGKNPNNVKHLTTDQILRNQNRNEQRRNNKYMENHIQPGCPDVFDNYKENCLLDMDHLGKYSEDFSTEWEINDWIETFSIKQALILGGLKPERVDLLIRCEVTGEKKLDIAKELGINPQSLTMQLQRIKKRAIKILSEALDYATSRAIKNTEDKNE